ncbi:sugar porter family MFS transporter [Chitinophaga sp. Mgbs1]|uniref:Sugar porter family MFS transporter n=1 Tax=Chitinophaga solisilvae TaxID=1233460 RepID=A0A3S1CY94_9BACT|nr:sugar porter family MFS transporter [Chitinophaga solisilvae]
MKNSGTRMFITGITLIAALGGLLFGFDVAVISGIITPVKAQYMLTSSQEGWFVSCALLGCIAGVAVSGTLSDRIGRKKVLALAACLFLISATGFAFASSYTLLICFRLLAGMGVGVASNISPLYISELAPASRRGRLVISYQLAITIGILLAYCSNLAIQRYALTAAADQDGWIHRLFVTEYWRGMFFVGVIPAAAFFLLLAIVPESPRWLAGKGRTDEARSILEKINGATTAATELQAIIAAATLQSGGGLRELLRPPLRHLLIMACVLTAFSQFSGINAVIYYGPTIMKASGIVATDTLFYQVLLGAANMLFTFIAIWKVDSLGRRPLYLAGSLCAAVTLALAGACFLFNIGGWVMLLPVTGFLLFFAFSLGPLKFVIATEIFPTSVRSLALSVCILVMWISDWLLNLLFPILREGIGVAATFFIFAGCCLFSFFYARKHLFETKGKSLEDITIEENIIHP